MQRSLRDMVVVITGASAGIGKKLAEELSVAGARLAISARRVELLDQLNRTLGGGHLVLRADVSRREDCEMLIARSVEHFGRIDTLVCNAGFGLYRRIDQTSPEETRELFATNVFGTTDCIAAAVPIMRVQELRDGWRGQIMIVSSSAARRGVPFLGMYCATKAAQLVIADALRVELRDQRIAVTGVYPIETATEFGASAEARSGVSLPRVQNLSQTVDYVVHRMIRAITRPRGEVWPSRLTKWLLAVGNVAAGPADWTLYRYLHRIEATNPDARPDLPIQ